MYDRLAPRLTEPEADCEAATEYVTETPSNSTLATEPLAISEYVAETPMDSVLAAKPLAISEYVSEAPRDAEPNAGTPK
jgi:hypothetical protein